MAVNSNETVVIEPPKPASNFDATHATNLLKNTDKPDWRGFYEYLLSIGAIDGYDSSSLSPEAQEFLDANELNGDFTSFLSTNTAPSEDALALKEMLLSKPSEQWDISKITPEALRQVGYLSKDALRNFQIFAEEKNLYPDTGPYARDGVYGPRTEMAAKLIQANGQEVAEEVLNAAKTRAVFSNADRMNLQQAYNALHQNESVTIDANIQEPVAKDIYDRITRNLSTIETTSAAALLLIDGPLSDEQMDALIGESSTLKDRLTEARTTLKALFESSASPTHSTHSAFSSDGARILLDAANALGVTDPRHQAYILATALHETGHRMGPVREAFGATDEQTLMRLSQYPWAQRYIGIDPGTGESYFGRGYVQLTWSQNYKSSGAAITRLIERDPSFKAFLAEGGLTQEDLQKISNDPNWLYKNPDYALNPAVSSVVTVMGMRDGLFTGRSLGDYFDSYNSNPVHARAIVNGDVGKNGGMIAGYYNQFLSLIKTAPVMDPVDPTVIASVKTGPSNTQEAFKAAAAESPAEPHALKVATAPAVRVTVS